jgi:hypothetical protein
MIGEPETLLVDSTLLSVLHPRQVSQGSGFPGGAWVRWGAVVGYGAPGYALSYGVLADIQRVSSLRDRQPVQVEAWTVCAALSHTFMLNPSESTRKPSDAILASVKAFQPDFY